MSDSKYVLKAGRSLASISLLIKSKNNGRECYGGRLRQLQSTLL